MSLLLSHDNQNAFLVGLNKNIGCHLGYDDILIMNSIFTLDVVKREKERKEGRKEEIYCLISFGVQKSQIQVLAGLAPSENSDTTILLF